METPLPAFKRRVVRPAVARQLEQEERLSSLATFYARTDSRLNEFSALPEGWDSYNGRPLSDEAAGLARRLVRDLVTDEAAAPTLVPCADGGIQLEWHRTGYEIEITISGDGVIGAYLVLPDGSTHEGRLSKRMRRLIETSLAAIAAHTHDERSLACVPAPEQSVRWQPQRRPLQFEQEVVIAADGERLVVLHELPQLFRRSVIEQSIDVLERADETVEQLLIDLEQGKLPSPARLKQARRLRRHRLERAIRELRIEAGWDQTGTAASTTDND